MGDVANGPGVDRSQLLQSWVCVQQGVEGWWCILVGGGVEVAGCLEAEVAEEELGVGVEVAGFVAEVVEEELGVRSAGTGGRL